MKRIALVILAIGMAIYIAHEFYPSPPAWVQLACQTSGMQTRLGGYNGCIEAWRDTQRSPLVKAIIGGHLSADAGGGLPAPQKSQPKASVASPPSAPAPTYQPPAPPNSVAAPYITSDCHQGGCAKYYLVKTFTSPPSAYPPFSTDQYLAHVKAIGYCNPGVLACAKGEYVAGDQGTEIYYVRCSEPGYIRVEIRSGETNSIEEPNLQQSHATLVSDAIWRKVCGR
jgi:hypothetical protein